MQLCAVQDVGGVQGVDERFTAAKPCPLVWSGRAVCFDAEDSWTPFSEQYAER